MPNKPYTIGKPFDIEELKKPERARVVSPRDQELEKAITQAAAGAASQVIPFLFDPEKDKVGTVLAAARRMVKTMEVPVNVGVNAALFPNAILLREVACQSRAKVLRPHLGPGPPGGGDCSPWTTATTSGCSARASAEAG